MLTVYSGDCIVSFAPLYANNLESRTAYLSLIAVFSAYSGNGIGSSLLRRVAAEAAKAGMKRLCLEARADNDGAIKSYRQMGFVV